MYTSNPERYQFAEQLYCFTDKTIQEIAELAKIPLRTLYQRARDYKWATLRRASRRSPMMLCEEMYRELSDLTAAINNRPEGQRIPTYNEAELRRKIVYSIAAIKKFPTHAEVAFILQSLLRYGNHFHYDRVDGLQNLIEAFLSHRDVYGFASYQPEHNQDMNFPTDQELELEISGEGVFRTADETTEDLNKGLINYKAPTFDTHPEIITKFKTNNKGYKPSDETSNEDTEPENLVKPATGKTFTA